MSGAGRITGPLRKDPDKKARRNKDTIALTVVEVEPSPQPDLPTGVDWHPQTIRWWDMWADSPLAENFTDAEWLYLTETAFVHTRFWNGDFKVAGELRLRSAKFGMTPEDRARLRIQVVTADDAEAKAEAASSIPSSRQRYQPPKVV